MGISRNSIRALRRQAHGDLDSFLLKDGTRFYYDGSEAALALFMFAADDSQDPQVPEFVRVVLEEAQDPRSVLETFRTGDPSKMFIDPLDLLELAED